MINGLFGSIKGKIVCAAALLWLAFSILLAVFNFPVFFYGITHGTVNFKDITTENIVSNQPINGNVHDVYEIVTDYYTDFISSLNSSSITDGNNIYVIPIEGNKSVLLAVQKGSKTDTELRSLLKSINDGEIDSDIIKNGVWIDAVGFTTTNNTISLAQDPINDINKSKHKKPIVIYPYIIDCSHPYSGFTFRFSLGVILCIALLITILLVIKRVKSVILADEQTVRESYIAANRTPPTGNSPAQVSYNSNSNMNNEMNTFDSSTRNVDYYNQGEISFGKFQTQGGNNSDDDTGLFGE